MCASKLQPALALKRLQKKYAPCDLANLESTTRNTVLNNLDMALEFRILHASFQGQGNFVLGMLMEGGIDEPMV